jgi:hypothetical protein
VDPAPAEDGGMAVPLAAVTAVAAVGLGALFWRRRNGDS